MAKRTKPKVFCVGFHKTGTSSMGVLLEKLGYRVQGAYRVRDEDFVAKLEAGDLEELMAVVGSHDAFQDNPWPLFYRQLDERFPGSKFILTTRDKDAWIRSVVNHFPQQKKPTSPMRQWIYGHGSPVGHEAPYVERYERHVEDVQAYFSGRDSDFLALDLSEPKAARTISRFLGRPIRWWTRMPHANRRLRT
jgi:hypothetical protein